MLLFYVPVIFDAASFYGHHEYDLGIAGMFGGFGNDFYTSYHSIIPKAKGFEERHQLYKLFHNLNHWYILYWHQVSLCLINFIIKRYALWIGCSNSN